jgi:hypothetical protein
LAKNAFFCQAEVFRQVVCEHAGRGCERPLLAREVPTGPPRQGRQEIIKKSAKPRNHKKSAKPRNHKKSAKPRNYKKNLPNQQRGTHKSRFP